MRRLFSFRYKNLQVTQLTEFERFVRAVSLLDPFFLDSLPRTLSRKRPRVTHKKHATSLTDRPF